MGCSCVLLSKRDLATLKHLWQELNRIHLYDSVYFKEHFQAQTFEKRCADLLGLEEDAIRIEAITRDGQYLGYCVSTIVNGTGEIESLFVDEAIRGTGWGKRLVEHAIAWFDTCACSKIIVGVSHGHESVFKFYKRFGFDPRVTILQLQRNQ